MRLKKVVRIRGFYTILIEDGEGGGALLGNK